MHFKKGPRALLVTRETSEKAPFSLLLSTMYTGCTPFFLNVHNIKIILYNVLQTWCGSRPLSVQLLINNTGPADSGER